MSTNTLSTGFIDGLRAYDANFRRGQHTGRMLVSIDYLRGEPRRAEVRMPHGGVYMVATS